MPLRAHGPLDGMMFGNWFLLVSQYGLPKLGKKENMKLAIIALRNSLQAAYENRHAKTFESTPDQAGPIFILGYWRSGTTHLHNLFASDERFAFPSQFDVNHPTTFVTSSLTRESVAVRRVQDNMLSSDYSPDEDEYALVAMTAVTPYLSLLYPSRHRHFYRYLSFSGATLSELCSFKSALLQFHNRLSSYYQKTMVYKSPGHTARVSILLQLFPNAKFVHIHREPSVVYQSKIHLLNSMFGDRLSEAEKHQLVVDTYAQCYDTFIKDLALIPEGNISHVAFSELEAGPLDSIRRIYDELGIPDCTRAEAAMTLYLTGQSGYKKNAYAELSEGILRELKQKWGDQAERFGYSFKNE